MTHRSRLAAALAVAALAACTSSTPTTPAVFAEPSSLAVFRGVTTKTGVSPSDPAYPYHPYLAVANAASNSLSILDGVDDSLVQSPALTRGLVYPVPGRPVLLASGDLGDRGPDLLVVVTAGDLPWLGGTQLQVVRTWRPDGSIVARSDGGPAVEFGADVLALLALPFDPAAPGSVTLVAALADERIATATFTRSTAGDGTGIAVDAAQATVRVSAPLGFQPLALAAIPGERTRVFAATSDPLPGPVHGVAQIDLTGTPPSFAVTALDAHAPTRLVAAGHLAEAAPFDPNVAANAFDGLPAVDRVWAVLDESGCGLHAPIACGLVAIDPVTRDLVPDPTAAGTMNQGFRAPIPLGYPLAMAFSQPPSVPPSPASTDAQFAGSTMVVAMTTSSWVTTGVAGVVSSDGAMTYVDLARWVVPTNQPVFPNVKATVSSIRPAGATGTQWLTLVDPVSGATVAHTDTGRLAASVGLTGGYTPNDHWVVTAQGVLPGLWLRRAEAFADGGLALQATSAGAVPSVQEVVRLWDPTLGVQAGDIVVVDPTGLGTCATFEATVASLQPPTADRPGGSVTLGHRTPTVPAWDRCVDAMRTATGASYVATFRAGGFVLVRGSGDAAVPVGRPVPGQRLEVSWQNEAALGAACTLPPSVPWPGATCDASCRAACEALVQAREARRIAYVAEAPAGLTGPALAFTLALTAPVSAASAAIQPRDLSLVIDTVDGRAPYRVAPSAGYPVDARQVVRFDRTPWVGWAGPRFLVPYRGGVVMDSSPALAVGGTHTIN